MTAEARRESRKKYYEKNREVILEKQRAFNKTIYDDPEKRVAYQEKWRLYSRKNYEKRLLSLVKSKCKTENIPFDLTIEDIVIPSNCPKTGIPMIVHTERGKFYDTPSIDRIDPKKGYTKGNIRFVCLWYNTAKLCFTDEEVMELCKKVVENG